MKRPKKLPRCNKGGGCNKALGQLAVVHVCKQELGHAGPCRCDCTYFDSKSRSDGGYVRKVVW